MVKKQKQKQEAVPTAQSAPNRDIIQRLNFSYQASVFLANLASSVDPSAASAPAVSSGDPQKAGHPSTPRQKKNGRHRAGQISLDDLSRKWAADVKSVGKKTTVRIDPSVKRTICERCSTVFIPGHTVSVRVKGSSSHKHVVVYTCLKCSSSLRIVAPPTSSEVKLGKGVSPGDSELEPSTEGLEAVPPAGPQAVPTREPEASDQNSATTRCPQTPSFSRLDAGHVVFRGEQKLELDGAGSFAV